MANELFTRSFSGNYPVVLSRQMTLQSLAHMIWGKWASFDTPNGTPKSATMIPTVTSSPVVIHNELTGKAGELLEVPLLRKLKNLPRIGAETMMGHEEKPAVNFAQVPVELVRHAEMPQEISVQTQITKDLQLLQNTEPLLRQHYAQVMDFLMCSYTMYYGYSWNVLQSARWSGDSKVTTKHHPHVFIAGQGKVSYGTYGYPGTSAYHLGIATEMAKMGAGDVFDTGFLNGLKADPAVMKIDPLVMKDGNSLRLIIAHPWQIASLEADSAFREVTAQAMVANYAKDNPYLVGAKYIWAGFAIFESDTAVWQASIASSLPVWGPTIADLTSFEDYSAATMFGAVILGRNAIAIANADRLEFKKRVDDYDEVIGIGYRHISGAARSDYWNREDGTTGQYMLNESSAVAVTMAAAPGF